MEYTVTTQHWGDQQYFEGDTREVKNKGDAEQLIKMGLIADPEAETSGAEDENLGAEDENLGAETEKTTKAAPKPKNKMAKDPDNKSE